MLRCIVIIPARSGSKSLPKKNILPLNGKPMLCYSVEYGVSSEVVDKVVVSTDSEEFADVARKCGAEVPFLRPAEFAQDNTRDYPVMRHALDYFESVGEIYDIYILLRPTSPLRPKGLIEKAIEIFISNPLATSVRSVAKIKEHPYRAWNIKEDGSMSGFIADIEEAYNIPRQELPEVYFQTGDFEAVRRETLLNGSVSGNNIYPLIIDYEDMVDIDHKDDLDKAEKRLKI
ncbi:acylneuraminate cytidylyltransferase family protein [Aliarcobacter butzleri]|uniref:acylneuraminate cytidylyltransferase family protein n=1 Tax=Aliarcobacter butzleri TaxID=28197 RepID=UPI0021B1E749|nr:acylneuraminate cytidylyltransferase family protein [Aliarcobacter butzleri]MCT7554885.1 acylneuraminate cytidylyltransferase family protein [Aliarcobacter butzleri]